MYGQWLWKAGADMTQTEKTINYYNQNAASFASGTQDADMEELRRKFADKLRAESFILDFGCGSGRDTRAFLSDGFRVEALDGSKELCRIAEQYCGIPVRQMHFQDFSEKNRYDGIWACASILHLSMEELEAVFLKMADALRFHGIIYASFKYGEFEGERNGRYFTDMTERRLEELLKSVPHLRLEEAWLTTDVRPGRDAEKWLNVILRKA